MKNSKLRLSLGAASFALVAGLHSPAQAACTVDGNAVDCTGDSTVAEINAAVASVSGGDVTLSIDGTAVQPTNYVQPIQQGAVAIDNAADLGTAAAPVGVRYYGTPTAADNTFSLVNTGMITDGVEVYGVGGSTTISTTGDIDETGTYGIYADGRGDIAIGVDANIGTVGDATTASDLKAVRGSSRDYVTLPGTFTSTTAGGVTTSTTTDQGYTYEGGSADIAIAPGSNTGFVIANGATGASITSGGTTGAADQNEYLYAYSNYDQQLTTTTNVSDATSYDYSRTTESTGVGGAASVDLQEGGVVHGYVYASGIEAGAIAVEGQVGTADAPDGAYAYSTHYNQTDDYHYNLTGPVETQENRTEGMNVGGVASIAIGATGAVTGEAYAEGNGGAAITVDGTAGLADNPSYVTARSNGRHDVNESESVYDASTGDSTSASSYQYTAIGGDASVSVGDTGTVFGVAQAFADAGDASVANAGYVSGNVRAQATSTDYEGSSYNVYTSDSAGYEVQYGSSSSEMSSGGSASVTNAAGGLIGESASSPVLVSASGNTAASVTNAGRINGSVSANSAGQETAYVNSYAYGYTSDATTGDGEYHYDSMNSSTSTNLGGDASFANAAGGLVTGSVDVRGQGSATVDNEGAVIGTTYVESAAQDYLSSDVSSYRSVYTAGPDGGTVETDTNQHSSSFVDSGGDVTGTYAGTKGAVQFAPFGGASDGSVTQIANGDSSALVSGTIFGGFYGEASGYEGASLYAGMSQTVYDADGDIRSYASSSESSSSERSLDSNSSLVVNGGTITGNANLYATGSVSAQLGNGASIDGSLYAQAESYGGYDDSSSSTYSASYDEDGNFVGSTSQDSGTYQEVAGQGDVDVAIGDAAVGGGVQINGAGGDSTFSLASDGEVGGTVRVASTGSVDGSTYSNTYTTDDTGSTTSTYDYSGETMAAGGNVSADVAGVIGNNLNGAVDAPASSGGGDLLLTTNAGNADANVTGQVRDVISVVAAGSDGTYAYQQTVVDGVTTAYAQQSSSTATGGTASLTVDAASLDNPANFGNVFVRGRSGSEADIGADSAVVAGTNGGYMQVGGLFTDTASTRVDDIVGGELVGQTTTYNSTVVGGDASLTNDGTIGYDGGASYSGTGVTVAVISPTSAEATNNGAIFGSIGLNSLFTDISSETVRTDLNDVTRVDTTTTNYVADGGTATLTNNGLITGDAGVAAVDGIVVNNGVLRGDLMLGGNVDNYTTQSVDTLTQLGQEEVLDLADALEQGYAVEQNGLLGGTIEVAGAFGNIDDSVMTSNITADIALNSGSVTGGGVVAEYDEATGERYTTTSVSLNGSGYLGLGDLAVEQLGDAFASVDPRIDGTGDLSEVMGGARVLGVDTLTKTGAGVFLITGADYLPKTNTNLVADYTLDLGTFAINGGEIQLATANGGMFGVRGDIVNAAGLVLGNRVTIPAPLFGTNGAITAIDGVEVYQLGDFTQTAAGTLTLGVTPTLVRVFDPAYSSTSTSANPLAVQQIGLASGLFTTPELAYGSAYGNLGEGFLTVDGDVNLAGTVQLVSPTGGLFTNGQTVDILATSGALAYTADVQVNNGSNFVTFDLATRTEGGMKILYAGATRAGYETVATNENATAAGAALSAALPAVVSTIQTGSIGGIGLGGDQFVLAQDLANIMVGFDTLLTKDQVATALNELASGEVYGSIMALETTAPFVDAISASRVPAGASGFNLWLAPSGDFVSMDGDAAVGSRKLKADNYGMSGGFGVATGSGELGVGFGYGRIASHSEPMAVEADANTWMVGAYARQAFGPVAVGADVIYGWSKWDASRTMPTLSRVVTSQFDSNELRADLRAEYMLDLGGGWVAPFGELTYRKVTFDGFNEEGAGAVSLAVDKASESFFLPSLGLRAGTTFDTGLANLRPEISVKYTFADSGHTYRDVAYLGAPTVPFTLQGVEPGGYVTLGAGLFADIGTNSGAFVRGGYSTGGGVSVGSVNAGVTIGF